ncbi:hypothetical protein I4F81_007931 [Pyropia yezoensis]|uniref:Uncharacterized protein n=1 Tax=Pyropia yezoensis TaxID=2788 RepID=A0ACC3C4Y6_PYRYE|nr:hypothetical protein I4F81_007931 [Neopyropia yezoensis]
MTDANGQAEPQSNSVGSGATSLVSAPPLPASTPLDALAATAAEANRLAREAALLRGRLRQLRLLSLQRTLRAELRQESRVAEKDGRRGSKTRARALRGLQRECERRTRAAAKAADSWERERRKVKAAWLAAVVDHATRFRQFHRDVVRRSVRVTTKAVIKFHEDRAKSLDRAGRDEERARIQKLRDDDEEGYLELVRQTKNSRLMELLNQTDSYLKELGAIVSSERANDERRDGPEGATAAAPAGLAAAAGTSAAANDAAAGGDGESGAAGAAPAALKAPTYYEIAHAVKESKIISAGMFDETSKDAERQAMLKKLLRTGDASTDGGSGAGAGGAGAGAGTGGSGGGTGGNGEGDDDDDEGEEAEEQLTLPSPEDINRMLERGKGELELFAKIDAEREAKAGNVPPLMTEAEIPDFVTTPTPEMLASRGDEEEVVDVLAEGAISTDVDAAVAAAASAGGNNMGIIRQRRAAKQGAGNYALDRMTDSQFLARLEGDGSDALPPLPASARKRSRGGSSIAPSPSPGVDEADPSGRPSWSPAGGKMSSDRGSSLEVEPRVPPSAKRPRSGAAARSRGAGGGAGATPRAVAAAATTLAGGGGRKTSASAQRAAASRLAAQQKKLAKRDASRRKREEQRRVKLEAAAAKATAAAAASAAMAAEAAARAREHPSEAEAAAEAASRAAAAEARAAAARQAIVDADAFSAARRLAEEEEERALRAAEQAALGNLPEQAAGEEVPLVWPRQ